MTYQYAVTLEFDLAPPETVRGEIETRGAWTAAWRAVRAAHKAHPRRQWRSLVVLLEKSPSTASSEAE
jgi:hypothetical protein